MDLYHAALDELGDGELPQLQSLVAHGGLGRRDVAPYSDVDLMLLTADRSDDRVAPLARKLTQYLYDSGMQVGFSVRTISQSLQMALRDATVFTSLIESRLLAGNERLFARYMERYRRLAQRRSRSLIDAIRAARRGERAQYGDTEYLLRPNVKRSRGGLRDIQYVRWVGFAAYGEQEPLSLEQLGVLLPADRRKLLKAHDFLLKIRNELHFHAGKPQDVLDRSEQLRLAQLYQYEGSEGLLPVEKFMRDYFENTSEVRYTVSNFVASARSRSPVTVFFGNLFSRRMDDDFLIGPLHIRATRRGLARLRGDVAQVLRFMDLANLCDKRIDHGTWEAIRHDMLEGADVVLSNEAIHRFLSLMSQPSRLGDLLRRLHQLRVLEKLVPPLEHARCLVQFNEYHKYTVDEHCIRAVERATEFIQDPGPVGEVYRSIRNKRTLHLALLLHDLGKGYPEDHSELGKRLAEQTAAHLRLPKHESELIALLVHKHLLMPHIAFRHDLNNDSVILSFALEVGSLETLRMLYVLSCADLAAVGPGTLNKWKLDLLTELFERTVEHMSGAVYVPSAKQRLAALRHELLAQVDDPEHRAWWEKQIASLPAGYLNPASSSQVLQELARLRDLPPRDAVAWGRYLPDRQAVEYTVGTSEEICQGIFHRLTGVLTSTGHDILTAEIHTLADNLVLDRFYVQDLDFAGPPPPERIAQVSQALVDALREPSERPPVFRKLWGAASHLDEQEAHVLPNHVSFDNTTSDEHTIVIVFAYDRVGLLYSIARALYELGLSVHVAKIATHLDQVVDVFYVTDRLGHKLQDEQQLAEVRERLLLAAENVAV